MLSDRRKERSHKMRKTGLKSKIAALLSALMLLELLAGCANHTTEPKDSTVSTTAEKKIYVEVKSENMMAGIESSGGKEKSADDKFIKGTADFAANLFGKCASGKENCLISPLSVMLALAMTSNGACGETKSQMESVLAGLSTDELNEYLYGYLKNLPTGEKFKLNIANSIWIKKDDRFTVSRDFLQKNADYYGAEAYMSDFDSETVDDINGWVSGNTDRMIEKIIDEIDPSAVMFLINAICFDTEWSIGYTENMIREGTFTDINGKAQTAEMMSSGENKYLKVENGVGFTKQYSGGNYSFMALLPDEGVGMSDFISSLTGESLISALKNAEIADVTATVPKFSFEYSNRLNEMLEELGIKDAFNVNTADFSNLGKYENGNLYVGNIIHKTYISLDSVGTRAGAVTEVGVDATCSSPTKSYTVTLDRPFVFAIIDNGTNLPLFLGVLTSLE